GGQRLAVQQWLLLSHMATFRWILRDRWGNFYTIISADYPSLGKEIQRVLALVEQIPMAEAMALLQRDWEDRQDGAGWEMAALSCVRACGLIGVLADRHLYDRITECLNYERGFLAVVLAAACFKVPAIASRIDLGTWTDTQYGCMRLLDN